MNIEFISEDWKKIPQDLRLILLSGSLLLFLSWLFDHWGEGAVSHTVMNGFSWIFFYSGLVLVLSVLPMIIGKQLRVYSEINRLRRQYPIDALNKSYYLVWFNGKLILFDVRPPKKFFHVTPWETAMDLHFANEGVFLKESFDKNAKLISFGDTTLELSDFADGGKLSTRS